MIFWGELIWSSGSNAAGEKTFTNHPQYIKKSSPFRSMCFIFLCWVTFTNMPVLWSDLMITQIKESKMQAGFNIAVVRVVRVGGFAAAAVGESSLCAPTDQGAAQS